MTAAHRARLSVRPLEDRTTPSPAGDLDPTFGSGGKLVFPLGPIDSFFNTVSDAVDYQGGKVLAVGTSVTSPGPDPVSSGNIDFTALMLNGDGAPDPTFGSGGRATVGFDLGGSLSDGASAAAVQPDGRIVLGGWAGTPDYKTVLALARLNPDGSPDPTFGTGAKVVLQLPGVNFSEVADLAVLPGGGIVVAGTLDSGFTNTRMVAARLNPDGSLDPTFGDGGYAVVPFDIGAGNTNARAGGLAVQPDGKLLLAGNAVSGPAANPVYLNFDFAAARLNPDGSLDPTFGAGGRVTVGFDRCVDPQDYALAVAVQPDGRILLAGRSLAETGWFDFAAARLNPDGSLDPTFGAGGRVTVGFESPGDLRRDSCHTLALQSDGKILVAGSSGVWNAPSPTGIFDVSAVARLETDGSLDPTFGAGGRTIVAYGGTDIRSSVQELLVRPDHTILLVGSVSDQTTGDAFNKGALARLLGDEQPLPPPPPPPPAVLVLAGGPSDGSAVRLVPAGGELAIGEPVTFFPDFAGTVRTAVADVNGDGTPDLVGGAGPGGGPRVAVIDGATGARVADFFAFEPGFTGGVSVAGGDLDGDGRAEVVVTPDDSGGPIVAVYAGSKLTAEAAGEAAQLARFAGIDDPAFRGGARAAVGDLNGDGAADLIVAAGSGGGPRVAVFDGRSVAAGGTPVRLVPDFFAFEPGLRNGAFVAAGDLDGDGSADLALGSGAGGAPRVRVVSGRVLPTVEGLIGLDPFLLKPPGLVGPSNERLWDLAHPVPPGLVQADLFADDPALRAGVRVAVKDADGDGRADLVTGSGEGEPSRVRVYRADTLLAGGTTPDQVLDPFGAAPADGVFVG